MSRYSRYSKWVWTMGLMGLSTAALADDPKPRPPQEPVGFVAGGVIGGFAAGPMGAVVGAGLGTWLGNRVHRASDAAKGRGAGGRCCESRQDRSCRARNPRCWSEKTAAGGDQPSLDRPAR